MNAVKEQVIAQLQRDILLMQGVLPPSAAVPALGLGPLEAAFPNAVFPRAALHEFVHTSMEEAACTGGFVCGLLSALMEPGSICIWVSKARLIFPPALRQFNIQPDRIIFIDLEREKDVLWVTEEALKCEGLSAVVAAIDDLSITHSRRLQLAIERSRVTGLLLRGRGQAAGSTSATRWRITPLPGETDGLPGLGHPRWNVQLQKVRNGRPGAWPLEWTPEGFAVIPARDTTTIDHEERIAG